MSLPLSVKQVTAPLAPVLLNPVTIELLLMFFVPLVGSVQLFEINVNEPVELDVTLVKVLLLMLFTSGPVVAPPTCNIAVIAPEAAAIE